MEKIKIFIQKLPGNEDLPLPQYMTDQAAGMDIFAAVTEEEIILPGQRKKIATGIAIALPEGHEAQIRPRSGLALTNGITLLNTPGTIDADYRGEIGLIVINHGQEPFVVKRGMRLAQMVVQKVCRVDWMEITELKSTSRGEGGFGHTSKQTS
ncbi:MAG TPA: dUTP diphosphatase [Smithella sp.]|nr:dUTP diphosphatase [Smithella sp.]HOG91063.1 dUTP diphosphatase [Smithella sp.]